MLNGGLFEMSRWPRRATARSLLKFFGRATTAGVRGSNGTCLSF